MFIGHYSAGFVAKAIEPRIPLGVLFLAAQIVDIAWVGLFMTGVEETYLVPGFTATNDYQLVYVPYSHSLAATLVWAAAAGGAWSAARKRWREGLLIGGVILCHWLGDLLVHTPDLPLWGDEHKQGFGLWNYPELNLGVEAGLLLGGAILYLRATRARRPGGRYQMLVLVAGMIAIQAIALFGGRPDDITESATTGLVSYLLLAAVAEWFDRGRAPARRGYEASAREGGG